MTLRRATRDDLPAVVALQRAAYAKNRPLLGVEPLPLLADYREVFSKYEVLSERELESRYEVFLEQYTTTINIEGETAAAIARTMLLPAAITWLGKLGATEGGTGIARLTEELSGLVDAFVEAIFDLEAANNAHPETEDVLEGAKYVQSAVIDAMDKVREIADKLEKIVPDDLWPLPKYSEILFIK